MSDFKQETLDKLNFENFYRGELPDLKPTKGDESLALCPFHEDTNPSLCINLKSGFYKCWGCGSKGDVFSFQMQKYGVDFKQALTELGRLAGVEKEPAKKAKARKDQKPLADSNYSDHWNSCRLVAAHGHDLRYCHLSKKWYFWNGKYWQMDYCGEVGRRSIQTVMTLYQDAAIAGDHQEAYRIARWANHSLSASRLQAMVRIAQDLPGLQVQPADMNANPWLLNCQNGTIDLRTGELRPHCRNDLITIMAPVDFNPDATCNLWETFLFRIMDCTQRPDTAARMVAFLQQALGYSLTGNCREECLFMLWGGGANGKSTLVNTISELLGDYSRNTPVESLLSRPKGGEIPTDIARLDGPRFVTSQEVDRGRRLAESLVKALTGRDTITARYLYGEFFDFIPQFKLWLSTNNKPIIKGADDAIWRRIMFIRFPVHIPKPERDLELKTKLMAEGPGILAWMVRGCLDWQRHGFDVPPEVIEDLAEYRNEMDVLAEWIEECCLVAPEESALASSLHRSYTAWADKAGLEDKEVLKVKTFGVCLAERGFLKDRGAQGQRKWNGVGLRDASE